MWEEQTMSVYSAPELYRYKYSLKPFGTSDFPKHLGQDFHSSSLLLEMGIVINHTMSESNRNSRS